MRNSYSPSGHFIILLNVLVLSGLAGSRGVTIAGWLFCVGLLILVAFAPLLLDKAKAQDGIAP